MRNYLKIVNGEYELRQEGPEMEDIVGCKSFELGEI